MNEVELKKKYLEEAKKMTPLKIHWVKKDIVRPCEAVLIYYKLEPYLPHSKTMNVEIINMYDHYGIYDVLMSSKFICEFGEALNLTDFVEWLKAKDYPIPEHLQQLQHECENNKSEEKPSRMSSVRTSTLIAELARRLMKISRQTKKNKDKPSTEIITGEEFKKLRAFAPDVSPEKKGGDYDDSFYLKATRGCGPRARKGKNKKGP